MPGVRIVRVLFCLLCVIAVWPAAAAAQAVTAQLRATVVDPQGRAVPQAVVTIRNVATGVTRDGVAGDDGVVTIAQLPPADYLVTATAPGFGETGLPSLIRPARSLSIRACRSARRAACSVSNTSMRAAWPVDQARALNWGAPHVDTLDAQALGPMFGTTPVELGLDETDRWLVALNADPLYGQLMRAARLDQPPVLTRATVVAALATCQRAIVSARSPWDRYHFDRDDAAISDSAKRGEVLFHSRPLSCLTCHGGPHFSNAMGRSGRTMAMPTERSGFKAPTLRNIEVTAPYMHDGSATTLDAVIDLYASGVRTRQFVLTTHQRADLLASCAASPTTRFWWIHDSATHGGDLLGGYRPLAPLVVHSPSAPADHKPTTAWNGRRRSWSPVTSTTAAPPTTEPGADRVWFRAGYDGWARCSTNSRCSSWSRRGWRRRRFRTW